MIYIIFLKGVGAMKKLVLFMLLSSAFCAVGKSLPWVELTDSNWKDILFESTKPIILAVCSDTCSVCRDMENTLYSLYKEFMYDYFFVKLDFRKYPRLGYEQFDVRRGLPTYIFFMDGAEEGRHVGSIGKNEFRQKLKQYFYS